MVDSHMIAYLTRVLENHGVEFRYDGIAGRFLCVTHYTFRNADGEVQSTSSVEKVEPTIKAVRLYLGY